MKDRDLTAAEQAAKNLEHAEGYLRTMTEARKDAEYREKIAKKLRDEAKATLERAKAAAIQAGVTP